MTPPADARVAWRAEATALAFVSLAVFLKLLYSARVIGIDGPEGMIARMAFATTLCLIAPFVLMPRRPRPYLLICLSAILSIVLVADELYFRRYLDVISPDDLVSAPVLVKGFARSVVINALRPNDLWYGVDVVVAIAALPFLRAAERSRSAMPFQIRAGVLIVAVAAASAAALPLIRLVSDKGMAAVAADRLRSPATIGPLPYQLFEVARRLVSKPEPLPDWDTVRAFLADHAREARPSALFGAARGKNLILVQGESLQGFPVGLRLDGQPVTPNIDAFAGESLRFSNFFDQTHHGFTGDGEFTTLSSLHPLPEGAASMRKPENHYRSLPALLADHGYDTISACADDGSTWAMEQMHPNHGFALSVFEDRFQQTERFNLLSDGQFFAQMMPRLADRSRPFMAFLVTSSNHGPPFDIADKYRTLRLPDRLRGTLIGEYLQSVHYFDLAFGGLIDELRRSRLLDETVVALYGDHQAYLEVTRDIARLIGVDPDNRRERWLTDRRMPFFVRLPGGAHAGNRDAPVGHLDIAPTLLSLLGVDDPDRVMFGRDMTSATPPFVVFRNGGFATADFVYAQPDVVNEGPACFEVRRDVAVDCDGLEPMRHRAQLELRVSDSIISYDLVPRLVGVPVPRTVQDVGPPQSATRVSLAKFDLSVPAPGTATYTLANGGGPVRLIFSPIIDPAARSKEVDGAVFEIWTGAARIYERRVMPSDILSEQAVVPPPPDGRSTTEIRFVTRPVSGREAHTTWQRLRFVVASAGDHHSVSGAPAR